jgi:hypothetical protein
LPDGGSRYNPPQTNKFSSILEGAGGTIEISNHPGRSISMISFEVVAFSAENR